MDQRRTGYNNGRGHAAEARYNSGRLTFLFVILFLISACVLFLQACDTVTTTKERGSMKMTEEGSAPPLKRPPIDLAAPAETETATFALG